MVRQVALAEQPARGKQVAPRVAQHFRGRGFHSSDRGLKGRSGLKPNGFDRAQSVGERMRGVDGHVEQSAGRVELVAAQSLENVARRGLEAIEGVLRSTIERQQRSALANETAQGGGAFVLDAARELDGHFGALVERAFEIAGMQGARLGVRQHDDIEVRVEAPALQAGVADRTIGKLVVLEHPARPAFVRDRDVTPVEADARGP